MSAGPFRVDQLARAVFNRAAMAAGMNDRDLALEVCRELGAIEEAYELRLRTSAAARTQGERRDAAFVGKIIATKYATACKICGTTLAAGAEVLWAKGFGCACVSCGEAA